MSAQGRQEYEINARYEVFTFLSGAYFLTNCMRIPGGRVPAAGRSADRVSERASEQRCIPRVQRTAARTILRDVAPAVFKDVSRRFSGLSINCARELCARTMLSRISRNPCGARRDHTQHALIPLLRTLWPAYACLPIYLPGCLAACLPDCLLDVRVVIALHRVYAHGYIALSSIRSRRSSLRCRDGANESSSPPAPSSRRSCERLDAEEGRTGRVCSRQLKTLRWRSLFLEYADSYCRAFLQKGRISGAGISGEGGGKRQRTGGNESCGARCTRRAIRPLVIIVRVISRDNG